MIKKNTRLPTRDKNLETTVLYVSLYSQFPATSYLPSVGMFFSFRLKKCLNVTKTNSQMVQLLNQLNNNGYRLTSDCISKLSSEPTLIRLTSTCIRKLSSESILTILTSTCIRKLSPPDLCSLDSISRLTRQVSDEGFQFE